MDGSLFLCGGKRKSCRSRRFDLWVGRSLQCWEQKGRTCVQPACPWLPDCQGCIATAVHAHFHSIRSDQDTLLAQFDSHSPVTFLPVGRLAGRRGPWSNSPSPFLPRSIGSGLQTDWFLLYHGLTKGQELKAKVVCWCARARAFRELFRDPNQPALQQCVGLDELARKLRF